MTDQEILEQLWDDYQLRQKHYWQSFNRFALVIVTVNIAPYVKPDIPEMLGNLVLVFPATAFVLSLLCTWYLGAEDQRLRMVRKEYYDRFGKHCKIPRMPTSTWWEKLVEKRIGTTISAIFGFCFTVMSMANIAILALIPINLNG